MELSFQSTFTTLVAARHQRLLGGRAVLLPGADSNILDFDRKIFQINFYLVVVTDKI
jgi:hypothetical protein